MQFLNPRIDISFKKLFGTQQNASITTGFLNAILERKKGEQIVSLQIMDPTNLPEDGLDKISFIDVKCVDEAGNKYIIEMQVSAQKDFFQRALYYSSKVFIEQFQPRKPYESLVPVIFVGVLDFVLFDKATDCLSHHGVVDLKTQEISMHHLEFHFIELSKFKKTLQELKTDTDKWIYLLKEAEEMDEIPRQMEGEEEIVQAMKVLERGQWSQRDRDIYEKEIDLERQRISEYQTSLEIGLQKGLEKGLEQGMQQGMQKGRMEGKLEGLQEAQINIAKKMLERKTDHKVIAEVTGLTIKQIEKL